MQEKTLATLTYYQTFLFFHSRLIILVHFECFKLKFLQIAPLVSTKKTHNSLCPLLFTAVSVSLTREGRRQVRSDTRGGGPALDTDGQSEAHLQLPAAKVRLGIQRTCHLASSDGLTSHTPL